MINSGYDRSDEWFWEGHIQEKIADYLQDKQGYIIISTSNTNKGEAGPDICAEKFNVRLVVEVKGYPSTRYSRNYPGGKKGDPKKTKPRKQTGHWFAEAILKIIELKCGHQDWDIALGFPNFKIFKDKVKKIDIFRRNFGIKLYFVNEDGSVIFFNSSDDLDNRD
jgi:Holliday junction resolvase-like predicted endonuclease